ncbi:alanine racemase [Aeromicrobium endophyticum]|nr:alanine racemase [Aeromicrobium endophyticum]
MAGAVMEPAYRTSLRALRAEDHITWRDRSFPDGDVAITDVAAQRWNLLDGTFHLPVMALRRSALDRNLSLMRDYCLAHDVLLAPHAKTTMSPHLAAEQLDAGAWGITVANVEQARVFISAGVRRLLIANPVVGAADLTYLAVQRRIDPDLDVLTLIDSDAAVEIMDTALRELGEDLPRMPVLIEVGYAGGRGGVRTTADAMDVADAVRRSQHLELVGIEGFEGLVPGDTVDDQRRRAKTFLSWSASVVHRLHERELLSRDTPIVSFGGSSFFDLVVSCFRDEWVGPRVDVVLRSGCYLTHDHGIYARTSPLLHQAPGPLPAVEVWGEVLSCPEPNLAVVGVGRRDVSTDAGLPIPIAVRRARVTREPVGLQVTAVNDQHAFVAVSGGDELQVGDLVCFGVSHPCTTFDKWRLIPLITEDHEVIDAIRTYF